VGLGALFGGISPPTPPPWRRDWFHFTISASQLVSGSVLGVFGSMVHWYIDWLIVLSNMTQHVCNKVVLRSSRRGNAVSRNNFSCEVREWHHVCKNFGGAIARFARSWLRPWPWASLFQNLTKLKQWSWIKKKFLT